MRMRNILLVVVAALVWGCGSQPKQSEAGTSYQLSRAENPQWRFGFKLDSGKVSTASGTDKIGDYDEVSQQVEIQGVGLTESVRSYHGKDVSLFSLTYNMAAPKPVVAFPDFDQLPASFHVMSFQEKAHSPVTFKPEASGSPWLLFDDSDNAMIIAPASHFLIQRINGDGKTHVTSELRGTLTNIPAGFTQQTLVAYGKGINHTWDAFGDALLSLTEKTKPANDADLGLKYLGYWTDNGAFYYYNFDPKLGYGGTLVKLAQHFRDENIPVKYMQLDSWWYYKSFTGPDGKEGKIKNDKLPVGEWNRYGGLMEYRAHPGVFPDGLATFQEQLGLPLITHNRWVDPNSPYHQEYQISGLAGVDPGYWRDIIDYVNAGGVFTYEQDWLSEIYLHSPELASSVDTGDKFLGGMADATKNRGMSMQYCMAMPQYYMQGSLYPNLTTIRTSDDRMKRDRWHDFLYASKFAEAVGSWPWADVYMSPETGNMLLADLSGGMVGFGDEMGKEDTDNIFLAVRSDGVIVKPDAPIVPLDSAYIAEANKEKRALVASTYTYHDLLKTVYVLAYRVPAAEHKKETGGHTTTKPSGKLSDVEVIKPAGPGDVQEAAFSMDDIGVNYPAYVYDFTSKTSTLYSGRDVKAPLGPDGFGYFIVAPQGPSGIAFFGDEGKFVSNGKQRIAEIHEDESGTLTARIIFAEGENSITLHGCSPSAVTATVGGQPVDVAYDQASGHFTVDVHSTGSGTVDVVLKTTRVALPRL
jgi:hypothetical protein